MRCQGFFAPGQSCGKPPPIPRSVLTSCQSCGKRWRVTEATKRHDGSIVDLVRVFRPRVDPLRTTVRPLSGRGVSSAHSVFTQPVLERSPAGSQIFDAPLRDSPREREPSVPYNIEGHVADNGPRLIVGAGKARLFLRGTDGVRRTAGESAQAVMLSCFILNRSVVRGMPIWSAVFERFQSFSSRALRMRRRS